MPRTRRLTTSEADSVRSLLKRVRAAIESTELDGSVALCAGIVGALATLGDSSSSDDGNTINDQLLYDGVVACEATGARALGYVRVSTDEQAVSGAGLAAQRASIRVEATRRGWDLLTIVGEAAGASSATLERNGLQRALERLDRGEADVLVVAKLDRLSRSVAQGALVMERAKRKGWSLVALDFGLDTTTPAGEMVANVILSTAQYERRMIGLRTREALAQKRAQGVRLGKPVATPSHVRERIRDERAQNRTFAAIADGLNADGIPTARGGVCWYPSTVKAVIASLKSDELAATALADERS